MSADSLFRAARKSTVRASIGATVLIGICLLTGVSDAQATTFDLIYTGELSGEDKFGQADGPLTSFSEPASFSVIARFDDTGPNLVASLPLPGFVSYAPSSVTITIGRQTYAMDAFAQNRPNGVTVSIFDPSNVFTPGRYGVGLFADPVADGAGFVGDFLSASPGFSVTNLRPTEFTGYQGAGFLAGVGCFFGPVCTPTPLLMRDAAGTVFGLQLSSRIEEVADGAPVHTARLVAAVPEPATWAMLIFGFGAIGATLRRREKQTRFG